MQLNLYTVVVCVISTAPFYIFDRYQKQLGGVSSYCIFAHSILLIFLQMVSSSVLIYMIGSATLFWYEIIVMVIWQNKNRLLHSKCNKYSDVYTTLSPVNIFPPCTLPTPLCIDVPNRDISNIAKSSKQNIVSLVSSHAPYYFS